MDEDFQDSLRQIIRDEVRPIIRDEVRPIIREETQEMRQDLAELTTIAGSHDMRLSSIGADIGSIKHSIRQQSHDIYRLDILLEDLNDRFAANGEQ